ncbi:hypothetical protein JYK00_00095 [Thermosipho ferrireducens]|uniref:Fibronectin type-III domain-containing protein n=1 Tax=Thermosipho ferrireducens TaxID=2571116 RepID=A0ABX7S5Z1_9BACT|nr:fibronectin type III domain-containing protein [Thermosipho ferrireducens]QTA37992.1 hypothetical protein JYK00_00095 [Thermosipho ferrireducens]
MTFSKKRNLIYLVFVLITFLSVIFVMKLTEKTPPRVYLLFPENNSFLSKRMIEFSWNVESKKSENVISKLLFGEATPNSIVYSGTNTVYELKGLEPSKTYYWKVMITDGKSSKESEIYKFTVINSPPKIISQATPVNEEILNERKVTLGWKAVDPDGDQLFFDLFFGTETNPQLYAKSLDKNRITIKLPKPGNYYWKVIARDKYGGISESPIWSFEVENHPPAKPSVTVMKKENNLIISWKKVKDLDGDPVKYDLTLYKDQTKIMILKDLKTNSYTLENASPGALYGVKLIAKDPYGAKNESDTITIKMPDLNQPPEVSLIFPGNRSISMPEKVVLKWSGVDPDSEDISYDIYIGKSIDKMKLISKNYKNNIYELRNLEPFTVYYWKIVAKDNSGNSSESSINSFSTGPYVNIKVIYGQKFSDVVNDMYLLEDETFLILGTSEQLKKNKVDDDLILLKTEGFQISWVKTFMRDRNQEGVKVLSNKDYIYILGNDEINNGDMFVKKLDRSGNELWTKYYGGNEKDTAVDMIKIRDGFIVLGSSWSADFIKGERSGWNDIFIMKIDFEGDVQWIKSYGGSSLDNAVKILDLKDRYVIVANTRSSDYLVPKNYGKFDVWIFSISKDGKLLWSRIFGGKDIDKASAAIEYNQNIIVAMKTYSSDNDIAKNYGGSDILLIELDKDGTLVKKLTVGGNGNDVCNELLALDDGIILIGSTTSTSGIFYKDFYNKKGLKDYFVMKITNDKLIWSRVSGGFDNDTAIVGKLAGNKLYFTGYTYSRDGDFNSNSGESDIFMGYILLER